MGCFVLQNKNKQINNRKKKGEKSNEGEWEKSYGKEKRGGTEL